MAKKKTIDPTKADDWMGFFNELNQEQSDRAVALVGGAFLDVRLEKLLANFLINASCYQRKLILQASTNRATLSSKPWAVTA